MRINHTCFHDFRLSMHNAEYFHISSINFYILFNNLVILFILHQMSNIVFAKDRDLHCSEVFDWIYQILVFI